jgi:hypothetical protein
MFGEKLSRNCRFQHQFLVSTHFRVDTKWAKIMSANLRSIRDFEDQVEHQFDQFCAMRSGPAECIDEFVMEDVADAVNDVVHQATYFNFSETIPSRIMCTPLEGMRIMGRILAWVRSERLRESPFLDIRQAMRYMGMASEKQIYGAIERGRLESLKAGKELRFTTEMLERFMQR